MSNLGHAGHMVALEAKRRSAHLAWPYAIIMMTLPVNQSVENTHKNKVPRI